MLRAISIFAGLSAICFAVPRYPSAAALFDGLPLRFEQHSKGASGVSGSNGSRFSARAPHARIDLTPSGTRLFWEGRQPGSIETRLVGANAGAVAEGLDPLAARTNYFVGHKQDWATGVTNFERVRYRNIYPGIDLIYYGRGGQLEFDFVIGPAADPAAIAIETTGARRLSLGVEGQLRIETSGGGDIEWQAPVMYQTVAGRRVSVRGRFVLAGKTLRFRVGKYNRALPLTIDPLVNFSTYLGGTGNEYARAIAADANGNVYVGGVTASTDLPVSTRPLQAMLGGLGKSFIPGDAFVAKFSSSGALVYLTYLGGSADDAVRGIAVDSAGNAYLTGYTSSTNFPTTSGAPQTVWGSSGGNQLYITGDAFLAKLAPAGDRLVYSTYLGGQRDDYGAAVAIDSSGAAYITGGTQSRDFPVTANAFQKTFKGGGGQADLPRYGAPAFVSGDAFVAKLSPDGTRWIYVTYLGGNVDDVATSLAVDAAGNCYVGGFTISPDFPTTPGAFQTTFRGSDTETNVFYNLGDGFVTKLNPAGSALVWSTYLGGKGDDGILAIAVDGSGSVFATGSTTSITSFPITPGVFQPSYAGPNGIPLEIDALVGDAFVLRLRPDGSGLVFSTFLGGNGDDLGNSIAVTASGSILVAGMTNSENFPVTADATQSKFGGRGGQNRAQQLGDGFLAQLDGAGARIQFATYYGGNFDDVVSGMAINAAGDAFLAGSTLSNNLATSSGAFQKSFAGASGAGRVKGDAFVVRYTGFGTGGAQTAVNSLVHAASNVPGVACPGLVFVLYGSLIGPPELVGSAINPATGRLETTRGGTRILFDGTAAPLVYVSSTQSSGIVPYSVAGKTSAQVVVEYLGQPSAPVTVRVLDTAPGLFSANFSGTGQAVAFNQDGSVNSAQNPAAAGSVLVIYGSGEGQTVPSGVDGLPVAPDALTRPSASVSVTIGGRPAALLYAGGVPFVTAGVFQANVTVPLDLNPGAQEVVVTIGASRSPSNLVVYVR